MAKLLLGSVVGPQGPQGTPGVNGSQGPQGVPGLSEIAATTNVVGLTSGQLLYNNGGKVGSVEIVDNLLSVNPNKPLSANQGKVLKGLIDGNSSAIGQLQTDMGNIDVSWNTITGKPTTFAPSTHDHTGQLVLEVGQYIDYHISGNTTDYDARTYVNGSGQFTITDANGTCSVNSEINSLKSSVVNGKQAVVNAINGSLGYASGLTTSHPHSDYAWWIQNKVTSASQGSVYSSLYSKATSTSGTTVSFTSTQLVRYTNIGTYSYTLDSIGLYVFSDANSSSAIRTTVLSGAASIRKVNSSSDLIYVTSAPCSVNFNVISAYAYLYKL